MCSFFIKSWGPVILLLPITAIGQQNDVCFGINSKSAVDQTFIARLGTAGIKHTTPFNEVICVGPESGEKARSLRNAVSSTMPTQCVAFDSKTNYVELSELLKRESIDSWLDKPQGPLCYLLRDQKRVEGLFKR